MRHSPLSHRDLCLLRLLAREPQHGYQLRQALTKHYPEYAQTPASSLYTSLERLRRFGFIQGSDTQGNKAPDRVVYRVLTTSHGHIFETINKQLEALKAQQARGLESFYQAAHSIAELQKMVIGFEKQADTQSHTQFGSNVLRRAVTFFVAG